MHLCRTVRADSSAHDPLALDRVAPAHKPQTALPVGLQLRQRSFKIVKPDHLPRFAQMRLRAFVFDPLDRAETLLIAIDGEEWLLYNVSESEVGQLTATTTVEDRRIWRSFLSENQLGNLIQPAESLSPGDLLRYIHNLNSNRLNSHQFRLALWQMVSLPVGIIAMALLYLWPQIGLWLPGILYGR